MIIPNRTSNSCVVSENDIVQKSMRITFIYEFFRREGSVEKDSIRLQNDYPKLNFSTPESLKPDEFESFYSERFGSICCPRDPQWDNSPTRDEFISYFEKENNVEITETYRKLIGKEGEVIYYYTLNGLSNKMKLQFILDRNFNRIVNRHLKDIIFVPQVFTPIRVEMGGKIMKM